MAEEAKITNLLLEKFVSEEIMTKSEFQVSLDKMMDRRDAAIASKYLTKEDFQKSIDRIMEKHETRIDARFQLFDDKLKYMAEHFDRQFLKIDGRYNWIIGLVVTSSFGLFGLILKLMFMIPH